MERDLHHMQYITQVNPYMYIVIRIKKKKKYFQQHKLEIYVVVPPPNFHLAQPLGWLNM